MLTEIQTAERIARLQARRASLRKPKPQRTTTGTRKRRVRVPAILPLPLEAGTEERLSKAPRAELPAHDVRWITDPRGSVVRWSDADACYLTGYWLRRFDAGPAPVETMHVRDDSDAHRMFVELAEDERRRVALALHGATIDGSVTLWAAELAMERNLDHRAGARRAVLRYWAWARRERALLRRDLRDMPSRMRRRYLRDFDMRTRAEAADLRALAMPYRQPHSYRGWAARLRAEWVRGWVRAWLRDTRPNGQLLLAATCG